MPVLRNIKYRELTGALEGKVKLDFRHGKERNAWFVLDGEKRLRVTAPKEHSGNVPVGTAKAIRKQLKLTTSQFLELVACPMTGEDFRDLIRQKIQRGLL